MTIKVGDKLPEATFMTMTAEGPKPTTTAEFFGRRLPEQSVRSQTVNEQRSRPRGDTLGHRP